MAAQTIRELAEKVADLIEQKDLEGMIEALRILRSHYPENPFKVAKSYEIVCLLVMKRQNERAHEAIEIPIVVEADYHLIRAEYSLAQGNVPDAFSLLQRACLLGARPKLARITAYQILRRLPLRDRVIEFIYSNGVSNIEVGIIRNVGCIMVPEISVSGTPRSPVLLCRSDPFPKDVTWSTLFTGGHSAKKVAA